MGNYYISVNGLQNGPYSIEQLRSMYYSGTINLNTLCCQTGMQNWTTLATIQHLLGTPPPNSPAVPVYPQPHQPMMIYQSQPIMVIQAPKSRVAFVLLGIFLPFGIHNFYAGYTNKGVAQLLIVLLTGWIFGLGVFAVWLWTIIEVATIDVDANGQKMT